MKKYYLMPLTSEVYFSHREAQCMAYFLRGYSNQEVASKLQISSSTVDSYVVNMKLKLRCKSKMELVATVCQTDFIKYASELVSN